MKTFCALVVVLVASIALSCTKESKQEVGNTPIEESEFLDGRFQMHLLTDRNGGERKSLFAYVNQKNSMNNVNIGTVAANGNELNYQGDTYLADVDSLDETIVQWTTTGAPNYPAVSYSDEQPFPYITNLNFPDSVETGQGITISFTTPDNTQLVDVELRSATKLIYKRTAGGTKAITFSPAEIAGLEVNDGKLYLVVSSVNEKEQTFGQRKYSFSKAMQGNYDIQVK